MPKQKKKKKNHGGMLKGLKSQVEGIPNDQILHNLNDKINNDNNEL